MPDVNLNQLIAQAAASPRNPEVTAAIEYVTRILSTEEELSDDSRRELIRQAARLPAFEFESLRERLIARTKLRSAGFDRLVLAERPAELVEDAIEVPEDEPWRESVDGTNVLDEVSRTLRRFIYFHHDTDADALALWLAGTHCYTLFSIFPRAGFISPAEECGKSTAIELSAHLARRGMTAESLTPSVAFRIIDSYHPTLFIDEMDTFIEQVPDLNGILNSGHKHDGFVWRMAKVDDEFVPERFATYGPVAYGRIGKPVPTLFSRSLFFRMNRKPVSVNLDTLDVVQRPQLLEEFKQLRRRLAKWTDDAKDAIKLHVPDVSGLSNRKANNWLPLYKIAAAAGPDWELKARGCAMVPEPKRRDSDPVRLLRDIRDVFHSRGVEKMPTFMLVNDLNRQEESPWRRYHNGRDPIRAANLADLLETFEINPRLISLNGDEQLALFKSIRDKNRKIRGYELTQFKPEFERYLTGAANEVDVSPADTEAF